MGRPSKVILFQGHMIDAPGRSKPRFPADKETIAARAIACALDDIGAGAGNLCICGGGCGGDLLFAEAALARGAVLELYIPFDVPRFVERLVEFADSGWRARFFYTMGHATLHVLPPEHETSTDTDPHEQNNLLMLEAAKQFGADKVDFLFLWNGEGGEGPGGIRRFIQEVQNAGGRVHWLDTKKLWK